MQQPLQKEQDPKSQQQLRIQEQHDLHIRPHSQEQEKSQLNLPNGLLQTIEKQAIRQHQIIVRVSEGTFSADKLIRLISNILKVARNFSLLSDLKTAQRMGYQIGQLRRLLRVDRLCMILRDYYGCIVKKRLTKLDYYMIIFRVIILFEDCSDILAFLIQMKVISRPSLLPDLRRRISDFYFYECIGWLIYHSYEYLKSETEQHKRRNRIVVIRYILDGIISHNDFSGRKATLNLKLISILGVVSSLLNLTLVWK